MRDYWGISGNSFSNFEELLLVLHDQFLMIFTRKFIVFTFIWTNAPLSTFGELPSKWAFWVIFFRKRIFGNLER